MLKSSGKLEKQDIVVHACQPVQDNVSKHWFNSPALMPSGLAQLYLTNNRVSSTVLPRWAKGCSFLCAIAGVTQRGSFTCNR